MRVIAGTSRGRRLTAPDKASIRPTGDRVRESIFDVLGSLGGVEGLEVADLFAGTGALGIEALSRGASSVVFVDRDPDAVVAIGSNLVSAGFEGGDAEVVRSDVFAWLGGAARERVFDLVLCDPPYAFDDWARLLGALRAELVVMESSRPVVAPDGWEMLREKRYGGTLVTVARARRVGTTDRKGLP